MVVPPGVLDARGVGSLVGAAVLACAGAGSAAAQAKVSVDACLADPTRDCLLSLAGDAIRGKADWQAMAAIATAQARLGRYEAALATAAEMPAGRRVARSRVRGRVAAAQARAGLVEQAFATVRAIPSSKERVRAFAAVGAALAETGRRKAALRAFAAAADAVPNTLPGFMDLYVTRFLRSMVAAGLAEEALVYARRLSSPGARGLMLGRIAAKLAETGRKDRAVQVLREAVQAVRSDSRPVRRGYNLARIVHRQGRAGDRAIVMAALRDVVGIVKQLPDTGNFRPALLRALARAIEATRTADGLKDEISEALALVGALKQFAQPSLLVAYARARAAGSQDAAAKKLFREAFDRAGALKSKNLRLHVQFAVVRGEADMGYVSRARATLASIREDQATSFPVVVIAQSRNTASIAIVRALAKAGRFDEAVAVAQGMKRQIYRDAALGLVVDRRLETGDIEAALRTAHRMTAGRWRARGLFKVAKALLHAGKTDRALSVIREALGQSRVMSWHNGAIFRAEVAAVLPR